jgi:hypothetical protein
MAILNETTRSISMADCLEGSKMVECRVLHDPFANEETLMFVYPDLFCRASGIYRLKFCLFQLPQVFFFMKKK